MTPQQLNKCLQKFYLSARRRDGTFYNQQSLTAIRAALDRHLRSPRPNKPFSIIGPLFIQLVWYILKQLFTKVEVNSGGYLPRRFGLMYKCDQYKHGTHLTSMARNEIHDFLKKILGFNHQRGFVPFIAKCVPVKCVSSLY